MRRTLLLLVFLLVPWQVLAQDTGLLHIFPQVADGKSGDGTSYSTLFAVTNVNKGPTACTLKMYGVPLNRLGTTSNVFTLQGQGSLAILETTGIGTLVSGYGALSCNATVTAQALYRFQGIAGLLGMATVFSSPAYPAASLPLHLQDSSHRMGIAFANDTDTAIEVAIDVMDLDARIVASGSVPVPARSSVARFLDQLVTIPFVQGKEFVGTARLSSVSGSSFSVIGLLYVGSVFTTIPATQMPWEKRADAAITLKARPAYGGNTSGGGRAMVGSSVLVSAVANPGWTFSRWSDGNTESERRLTMVAGGLSLSAYFRPDAGFVVHQNQEMYDTIKEVMESQGVSAAVDLIRSLIRVGDSHLDSSGNTYLITDLDVKANGAWVIGDGSGPSNYTAFYWYSASGARALEVYLGH